MATHAVVEEISLLVELEVFHDDATVEFVSEWLPFDFFDREDAIDELLFIDGDNIVVLEFLEPEHLESLSPALRLTLGPLPDDVLDQIESGETRFLDPQPWLDAAADLIVRRGLAPSQRTPGEAAVLIEVLEEVESTGMVDFSQWTDLGTAAPLPPGPGQPSQPLDKDTSTPTDPAAIDPAATDPAATDPAATDPAETEADATDEPATEQPQPTTTAPPAESPSSSFPILLVLAGAAVGLMALAVLFLRRRPARVHTPKATEPSSTGLTDVLETTRRMTAALDEMEIQTIAVSESIRLTTAEAGAFVSAAPDGARYTVRSMPELFADQPITSGVLCRVMEAGQAVQLVSHDEPSLARLPAALAAVPVIAKGGVTGAIVVVRRSTSPFTAEDVSALELLAPITGSALGAAALHNTAVIAADRDGLTNLHNRRRLDQDLAATVDDQAIGFAMIDVDFFKKFNDTYGHSAGDEALRLVATAIADNVRADDRVYRYGGEEFSVLLHHCTIEEALVVLERVRQAVEEIVMPEIEPSGPAGITISVGLATADSGPADALTRTADAALYEAKDTGRNRIVVAD